MISRYLTWEEYHYHFLVDNQLMQPAEAKKHDEAHGDLSPDGSQKILNLKNFKLYLN